MILPSSITTGATAFQLLKARVCDADAVVYGRVRARKALLSESKVVLFTDFTVVVSRWLRPVNGSRQEIVSSSVGGYVLIDGKPLSINAPVPDRFRLNEPHVYFLKAISGSDSFFFAGDAVPHTLESPKDPYLDDLLTASRSC